MNWSLHLVTDRELAGNRPLAQDLKTFLKPRSIPLIINDAVEVAQEIGADGIHVGQSDMDVLEVRARLGDSAIIGLSIETEEQAIEANDLPIDYIGISPVFATPTKEDHSEPWGYCQLELSLACLDVSLRQQTTV